MKKVSTFSLVLCVFFSMHLNAINYYLSNQGNDKNKGTSPNSSWQTIERLNEASLQPGDSVLFHSDQTFIGSVQVNQSGKKEKPIVFSTYGKGDKAVISGAYQISNFKPESGNIFAAKTDETIKHLYQGTKIMTLARYPNHDVLTMEGGGEQHLVEENKPFSDEILTGATARLRPINWVYDYRKIEKVEGNKLHFSTPMYRTANNQGVCRADWTYYLDSKKEFLDAHGEWIFDTSTNQVMLYSNEPLQEEPALYASFVNNGFVLNEDVSDIVIKGLQISHYSLDGILLEGNHKNIKVTNCSFKAIYRNGLNCEKHGEGLIIQNNLFTDVYGRGISLLESWDSKITHNKLHRIGMKPAYGIDGLNGAIGILISNRERVSGDEQIISNNTLVGHNYIDSTGYIGIRIDGSYNTCEYNSVNNTMLTLNDGAGIYCWARDSSFTHHTVIQNNVIQNVVGNTFGTTSDHKMNNGIYLDNYAHHITVKNNYISGAGGGIHTNAGSYNNTITGNTLFGNGKGLSFAQWGNGRFETECENNICTNNIVFNTLNMHPTLKLLHTYEPEFNPGIIDSNIYASPNEMYHIYYTTMEDGCKNIRQYTLEAWQNKTKYDANSTFIYIPSDTKYKYFVNDGEAEKSIDLESNREYTTLEGEKVSGNLRLKPYTAQILLYRLK